MLKRIMVLAVVVFFAAGTLTAFAGDKASCSKGFLQGIYDWCAGMDKPGGKKVEETCCKACGKECCKTCHEECGCQCCANCGKK